MKFQYGRKDCIPTNPTRPYETTKIEVTPTIHGSTEEALKFMRDQQGLSARDFMALMGIHSVVAHPVIPTQNEIEALRYMWIGTPYFSNIYHKIISGKPIYDPFGFYFSHNDKRGENFISVGDENGNPIGGAGFR